MRWSIAVGLVVVLSACAGDDSPEDVASQLRIRISELEAQLEQVGTSTTVRAFEGVDPSSLNTTTTVAGELGRAQVMFTELVRTYCVEGTVPNPLRATFTGSGDDIRVIDTAGTELRLDMENRTVTSPDGPNGILPMSYGGCAVHVFQGYADH